MTTPPWTTLLRPGLPTVFGVFETTDQLHVVTDRGAGGTLADAADAHGALPPRAWWGGGASLTPA